MGNPRAIQFLYDTVAHRKPDYIFLCETLCRKDVLERVRAKLKFEGMFAVDACGRSGGVALLWRHKEDVKVLNYATNFVDVEVRPTDVGEWRLTGFYGESKRSLRGASWEQLRTLARGNTLPWCVIGDMNNVLSQEDKKGGHLYPNCLGVANFALKIAAGNLCVIELVKECWEEYNLAGIQEKIQRCGESLSVWGKDYSGNFASRIQYWKKEVRRWKQGRDPDAISKYKEAETELFEVLTQKEVFWRQRSKQLWLQEGDKNSKFFHATASSRRRMNAIDKLQCEDGSWVGRESNYIGCHVLLLPEHIY
ncbi:uncharacterized protein LOC133034352 [Cannabis sativa]|uniref:uncharacterized protein LOC133034352 n=1 Tax=Cannabis sativa TaxID=3483 RepID=UPI0029C9DAA5|nr:uncharacterized protein LOC133034352 [Cannabis sativa]